MKTGFGLIAVVFALGAQVCVADNLIEQDSTSDAADPGWVGNCYQQKLTGQNGNIKIFQIVKIYANDNWYNCCCIRPGKADNGFFGQDSTGNPKMIACK